MPTACVFRPLVTVYTDKNQKSGKTVKMPAVFSAPIRTDIVQYVHTNIRKNSRQPYSVSKLAGHQTSAESWGTGRAVARIPRVRGGGTHRSGQGAYGNMCRGGRRFAPTRVWRRWHRKVNRNQRRYAVVSAVAATGVPSIVQSRGHRVENIAEFPFVVSDKVQELNKTKQAVKFLRQVRAWKDIERVYKSKRMRAGKGKMRGRRRVKGLGPVIIYSRDSGLTRAFRNIPGVETINVEKLSLLRLAPGGQIGRFCIWTEGAFRKLDRIFGTWTKKSMLKRDYMLPQPTMANTDIARILKSDEIKKAIRPRRSRLPKRCIKRNPLKNIRVMARLNPYAPVLKKVRKIETAHRLKAKKESIEKAKKLHKAQKEARKKRVTSGGLTKKGDKKKQRIVKKDLSSKAKK
ncbi:60S ribosomal protein L4 [Fragariocoptes setiger]|uniref:60S ribosomal protein L4 n=1 Tax=Fragariocoptes setiger TaxID=1670756 RepID=A0ABQ7S5B9_9ACAR|nr:60S ribosomal protein L4 [Fragariocoptes setiger]